MVLSPPERSGADGDRRRGKGGGKHVERQEGQQFCNPKSKSLQLVGLIRLVQLCAFLPFYML